MYGKYITVKCKSFSVEVFVFCTPDESDDSLLSRAKEKIIREIEQGHMMFQRESNSDVE